MYDDDHSLLWWSVKGKRIKWEKKKKAKNKIKSKDNNNKGEKKTH